MRRRQPFLTLVVIFLMTGCGGGGPSSSPAAGGAGTPGAQPAGTASKPRALETYMVLLDLGIYESKIAPAFEKYVNAGDTSPLRQIAAAGVDVPELDDRKKRLEVAQKLAPAIMDAKCLVRLPGVEPYQLGASELVSYLYSASDWLRETLTSKDISDITLEYPLGEHAEIIRATDAAEIRVNIRNIPAPEDANIKRQLAALLRLMDDAAKNPRHAIAMVMR